MTPQQLPLRDIHLPEPIGWWPVAPGWWILAGFALMLGLAVWLIRSFLKRGRLRKEALRLCDEISLQFAHSGDVLALSQALSSLLRRISLKTYPRQRVASLTGEEWLTFLQQGLPEDPGVSSFTKGPGRALAEAPYNPRAPVDAQSLVAICRAWIIVNTPPGNRP